MRTLPAIFALLTALLAPSAPATAADTAAIKACLAAERTAERDGRACIGRTSDPCLETPGNESTMSMVACISAETEAWDEILNADYNGLLGALNEKAQESVRKAQRAWIALRDADCAVPYEIFEGGTMALPIGAQCGLERTAARVLQLRLWRQMVQPEDVARP